METLFAGMFSPEWLAAFSGILLLDILLSGDNAILIALACQNLPAHNRKKAIFIGGFGAVFIRIVCTLFATSVLAAPYIEFVGGAALLYIAVKLLTDHKDNDKEGGAAPASFGAAVRTILVADFIMSIDNILSLAGVANTVPEGKWSLIICGLLISIPIVLFGAQIFLKLMQKLPALIYGGAAILGWTAAALMVADKGLGMYFAPYALEMKVCFVVIVLGLGYYLNKRYEKEEKLGVTENE
ncbi:TerC family protein [Selenomonas sp. AE3005]|uniref:TerC family protein n=1 Tax=Selenomonas sp. AE3005 TaxID=1485543 RepID=UPI0025E54104|nr:TerC family protein [Selenomonas sp. AE3005]